MTTRIYRRRRLRQIHRHGLERDTVNRKWVWSDRSAHEVPRQNVLRALMGDGLIIRDEKTIRLTDKGFAEINSTAKEELKNGTS